MRVIATQRLGEDVLNARHFENRAHRRARDDAGSFGRGLHQYLACAEVTEDLFGDFYVSEEPVNDLTVVIIGKVASHAALEDVLQGWEEAMLDDNSLAWLRERFPEKS